MGLTEPTDAEIRDAWEQYNPMHGIESFARAVLAKWGQPAQAAEQVATQWLAEMIMSDCGCSTENQRLLDRIIDRIQQYDRANTAPQPVAREPLSGKQAHKLLLDTTKHMDIFDTGRMTEDQLAAEAVRFLLAGASGHGIKGDQHG